MESNTQTQFPILPLRDVVMFPHMIVPLFVGREKSVRALEEVMREDKQILLLTQKDTTIENPNTKDLHLIGTVSNVLQMLKLPDETVKVLVEGRYRAKVASFVESDHFLQAKADIIQENSDKTVEIQALARTVMSQFEQYAKLNKKLAPEVLVSINQIEDYNRLADTIAAHLVLKQVDKQALLEAINLRERFEKIGSAIDSEINLMQVERRIRTRVKRQMEKTQREYYLNEQLKAIQKELGETEDGRDETSELEQKIRKTKLSKEAKEKAMSELRKLKTMSPMSAEATVVRNYLDWVVSIPWNTPSKIKKDLNWAKEVLDQDHYGLDKVKERILEYLAVQQRMDKVKGPILCLVGPPGVGKTSLGKSIAKATGRNFVRMSLGGVRDEAEIRGHRRTYIGSMPGKVVQAMKKSKSSNPLFLLDEIDKLGADWRGDPSSALLEVLDPEQNSTFADHYLEVDYDLSDVMFITTANSLQMPQPLLDRMEIIRLPGYTEDEKVEIAKRHLLPKVFKESGIKEGELTINEEAIRAIIRYYTREAGVRSLERELANLTRKVLKEILMSGSNAKKDMAITGKNVEKFLGVRRFHFGQIEQKDMVGVTTGLAWTEVGGDILTIEAAMLPGKGKIIATGKLGDVMKESAQTAESLVKTRSADFGIKPTIFQHKDIHVHVPEGATPKDGPSAGIAIVTSIVSILTGIAVRRDIAMTGEITLRGRVLPIGGLKEKLLAALRAGIKHVLVPQENKKDMSDVPDNVKKGLKITYVSEIDHVLREALVSSLKPIKWVEDEEGKEITAIVKGGKTQNKAILAH